MLDADYRPLADPSLPAMRPEHPKRLRAFMMGCGQAAAIIDGTVKDERPRARRERERRKRAARSGREG